MWTLKTLRAAHCRIKWTNENVETNVFYIFLESGGSKTIFNRDM